MGLPAPPRHILWPLGAMITVIAIVGVSMVVLRHRDEAHADQPRIERELQLALPFSALHDPRGVAVDRDGNVYVTDVGTNQVLKLAAGSNTQTVLPFNDLDLSAGGVSDNSMAGIAVDGAGAVYVVDTGNNRVLKLAAGSSTQTVLPFSHLNFPTGLAVDSAGAVYVADRNHDRVVKVAAGSSTQTVLPSLGGGDPHDVAVDGTGVVYVSAYINCGYRRICQYPMRLAPGADTWTKLPSAGIDENYVAVDTAGNLYVMTSVPEYGEGAVRKLPAGSSSWTDLPGAYRFTTPGGLAVDNRGHVYVTDNLNPGWGPSAGRGVVVRLPKG